MTVEAPTTDRSLERVKEAWRPRFLANGIQPYDYETTVARIAHWADWLPAWRETADGHVERAEAALAEGHTRTAAGYRHLAALCLHFGHFASPRPLADWQDAQRRKVALFQTVIPFLDPPAELVEMPFEAISLPGYLRKPRGVERPPVVLFFSGLDSTKEEHTTFEAVLLARGLATLTFDGPGQGEVWERMPGRVDWEKAASAVVDWVEGRPDLDAERIVAVGVSLGGYLVSRCASLEPRIRAAACCGGRFDNRDRDLGDPLHTPRLLHYWGVDSAEAVSPFLAASTLDGVIQRMDRPLLVVHGDRDSLAPTPTARTIYDLTGGPKRWVLYPEGNHVCNNIPHLYRPLVADWLADQVSIR